MANIDISKEAYEKETGKKSEEDIQSYQDWKHRRFIELSKQTGEQLKAVADKINSAIQNSNDELI